MAGGMHGWGACVAGDGTCVARGLAYMTGYPRTVGMLSF